MSASLRARMSYCVCVCVRVRGRTLHDVTKKQNGDAQKGRRVALSPIQATSHLSLVWHCSVITAFPDEWPTNERQEHAKGCSVFQILINEAIHGQICTQVCLQIQMRRFRRFLAQAVKILFLFCFFTLTFEQEFEIRQFNLSRLTLYNTRQRWWHSPPRPHRTLKKNTAGFCQYSSVL